MLGRTCGRPVVQHDTRAAWPWLMQSAVWQAYSFAFTTPAAADHLHKSKPQPQAELNMLGSGWSTHLELLLLSPGSLRVGTCCPQFLSCLDPQLIQLGLRTGSAALQGLQVSDTMLSSYQVVFE